MIQIYQRTCIFVARGCVETLNKNIKKGECMNKRFLSKDEQSHCLRGVNQAWDLYISHKKHMRHLKELKRLGENVNLIQDTYCTGPFSKATKFKHF